MPLPIERNIRCTAEDYYNLPDDVRAELIDGKIYFMAAPTQEHQEIAGEIFRRIANYVADNRGPCKVLIAPFDVKLKDKKNEDNIVQPDIIVVCDPQKLNGKECVGAPDFVIEISSPTNATNDYVRKLQLYESAGVGEYWIVNPTERTIVVYSFMNVKDVIGVYSFENVIKPGIYDDLEIDFKEVMRTIGASE